ncbi:MAG: S8 family serine peptidase [Candidatus Pacearchaeota archaeon]
MFKKKKRIIKIEHVIILFSIFYILIFFLSTIEESRMVITGLPVADEIIQEINENNEAGVIVILNSELSTQDILLTLNEDEFKLKYQYNIINGFSGNVTLAGLKKLSKNSNVIGIYPDEKYEFFLDKSAYLINATKVWQMQYNGINLTGKDVSICVIDSGVNDSHPALAGKVIEGYNFVNNTTDYTDILGHGTKVAGIIVSNDAVYRGIAPDAKIIAMKVSSDSEIIAAIEWCLNNASKYNISVISMSMGNGFYNNQTLCDSLPVSLAANKAKAKNVLFVAASGNNGLDNKNVIARPACASNVTSVSATLQDDSVWEKSQTALFLDLFAPGNATSTDINGGFSSGCGTSMATPHVAGAAALIYQYEKLMNLNATPDEVEKLLKLGGKPIYDPASEINFSRIDIFNSINLVYIINVSDNSFSNNNAKVKFNSQTDLTGIIDAFNLSYNLISLNSDGYQKFNKSATLTLYNLNFTKTPLILKNSDLCLDCSIISYNGNLTFYVPHFTNYSAEENSKLEIWDSFDPGMPYYSGNSTSRINQTVYFFANYTNRTSNQIDNTASCNITFADSSGLMWFNETKNIFEYSRNFSSLGQKLYSISCNSTQLEPLILSDFIWVTGCIYPGPNINWTINESTGDVYCKSEALLINNTDILVQDGYSLTLENVNLTLIAVTNKINISANANFTVKNSTLAGMNGGNELAIYNLGRMNLSQSTFTYTFLDVSGKNTNYIDFSFFYGPVNFKENSTNYIYGSYFNDTVDFRENSNSIVSSCMLEGWGYVYFRNNAVINFSYSNITKVNPSLFYVNPLIFGNVNFSSVDIIIGNVTRYYPVLVRYSGTGNPVVNKSVNITNYFGNLVWSGTTDSTGRVIAILNLNRTNFGEGNFTISVNPSSDISLSTDTPIILEVSDLEPPIWYGNNTIPDSGAVYDPYLPYQLIIRWDDNNALSDVWFEHNFFGNMKNYSTSSISGNSYYYNFNNLAAGSYLWKSCANDISGNSNCSDQWNFIVNKASSSCSLVFDKTSPQSFGTEINVSCSCSNPEAETKLFRDNEDVTVTENNKLVILAEGIHNYVCNVSSSQNYSDYSITGNFIILRSQQQPAGGGGGGGQQSLICKENWQCSEWSECINGMQKRICNDLNNCNTTINKPLDEIYCSNRKNSNVPLIEKIENIYKKETENLLAPREECKINWLFIFANLLILIIYCISFTKWKSKKQKKWLINSLISITAFVVIALFSYLDCNKSLWFILGLLFLAIVFTFSIIKIKKRKVNRKIYK